jgi:cholesterol transport system auxiliary component
MEKQIDAASFLNPPGDAKLRRSRRLAAAAVLLAASLAACTTTEKRDSLNLYDLGYTTTRVAPATAAAAARMQPVAVSEVSAPVWMDSTRMYYRLSYDNPLEARTYSQSRWTTPPSRLFQHRLKTRIGEAGGAVLGASDGAAGILQLRLDADDFSHVFSSPQASIGRVVMRASVLRERRLVAQRVFTSTAPAPTADAAGGVQALAQASDAVIEDMIAWLASLPQSR